MSDSEESDGEGGLGNLSRLVMRPPGHSGKAKRGHLCFDASFETGNLGRVDYVTDSEYDLFVRPDTCSPHSRFWFNFTVDNIRQDQRAILNFVNFGKAFNLFKSEMTPLVKSTTRPKWQRIPKGNVFYHRSIHHHFRYVLSIAFCFDKEDDIYQFCLAPPYSYSRLQTFLDVWAKKAKHLGENVTRETIAQSIQKRKIELITIGDETEPVRNDETKNHNNHSKRRTVVLLARCHGGESPSSFVVQGLMEFMISSHSIAQQLRQRVTLKIIPMVNPDGVHLGNQRTNLVGADLNRKWPSPSTFLHPPIVAAKKLINTLMAHEAIQLDLVIDLHAHTTQEGVFLYGSSYDDIYRFERHAVLGKHGIKSGGEPWSCVYNADTRKAGTARRALAAAYPNLDVFTLQISMGGRRIRNSYVHYTEDAYVRFGRYVGKILHNYYRYLEVIPSSGAGGAEGGRAGARRGRRGRASRAARGERAARAGRRGERPERPEPPPERRCVPPRVLSPPLPRAAVPPAAAVAPSASAAAYAAPRVAPPAPPALTVLDVNSSVRWADAKRRQQIIHF